MLALPPNHIIRLLMDSPFNSSKYHYSVSLKSLTSCQRSNVKGHLVDSNNKAYGVFSFFSPLYLELSPGSRIINNFSDCFSFNLSIRNKNKKIWCQQLNNMVFEVSLSNSTAIIISNASIKNNIATSISHVHIVNQPLIKTLHHTVLVMTTEVELFVIRCGINKVCSKDNVSKIVIVTNSIHAAKKIFDSMLHSYQGQAVAILSNLHQFFTRNQSNSIEFWECPSWLDWNLHKVVDRDSKSFNPLPIFPNKISWDYCKKVDCNNIINTWKITFQASDGKGWQFLDLVDSNFNIIEPSYTKRDPWLQSFSYSNSLCAYTTRVITNHALIGKYWLRFFPNKEFKCPCDNFPIKSRRYILHEYTRFNGYWNPKQDSLDHFVMFLVTNPAISTFNDSSSLFFLSRS